jgi:ElaB/YqjD/DUF883 family membrane-anchored ribosome-binding protein
MTPSSADKLSHDLQNFASEVSDHLQDAAQKTGKEASDALRRSSKALDKAVECIRSEAQHTSKRAVAEVRAHPAMTGTVVAAAFALIGLLVAARYVRFN